jgi:hypothetical protein
MARLPGLDLLLTGTEPAGGRRRRTRRGVGARRQVSAAEVIGYLRQRAITLTCDASAGTMQADATEAITTVTGKAS